MRLSQVGTDTFHILTNTTTDGDKGYRADTACGLTDQPWDATVIDQMPSGGAGGSCVDCQIAMGLREAPKKTTSKKPKK